MNMVKMTLILDNQDGAEAQSWDANNINLE